MRITVKLVKSYLNGRKSTVWASKLVRIQLNCGRVRVVVCTCWVISPICWAWLRTCQRMSLLQASTRFLAPMSLSSRRVGL